MIKRRTPINKVLIGLIIFSIFGLLVIYDVVDESRRMHSNPTSAESQIRIDTIWNGNDIAYTTMGGYEWYQKKDGGFVREFKMDTIKYTIECYTILHWDMRADTLTDYCNHFYKVQKMEIK